MLGQLFKVAVLFYAVKRIVVFVKAWRVSMISYLRPMPAEHLAHYAELPQECAENRNPTATFITFVSASACHTVSSSVGSPLGSALDMYVVHFFQPPQNLALPNSVYENCPLDIINYRSASKLLPVRRVSRDSI